MGLQVAQIGEGALITALGEIFGQGKNVKNQLFGIGDDGAVLAPSALATVATMDLAVEDVHFKTDWSTPRQIGAKVAVANIADIYAMGGEPHSLLVGISLTGQEEVEWVLDLARGIADEAKKVVRDLLERMASGEIPAAAYTDAQPIPRFEEPVASRSRLACRRRGARVRGRGRARKWPPPDR